MDVEQSLDTYQQETKMRTIPVDTSALTFIFMGVIEPAVDRDKGAQRSSEAGVPLWRVPAVVVLPGEKKPEGVVVIVPNPVEPKLEQGNEIKFRNLRARVWSMNGSSGTSLTADAFETPKRVA